MKILFSDSHTYPFASPAGSGKKVTDWPSGSSKYAHDLMVRALAEAGHDVFYFIKHTEKITPHPGIHLIDHLKNDVDVVHLCARLTPEVAAFYKSKNIPVLATNHLYKPNEKPPFKWVHVSKTLATLYKDNQYIWIGIDPDDFIYSIQKQDYFLFIADMSRHMEKGLDIALNLSREKDLKLVVAGSSRQQTDIDAVIKYCDEFNATYVGDVRGKIKAELLAGSRAVISPSRLPETFGLTLAEALISGTPVICSNVGAYNEIINSTVGFVCNNQKDYHHAVENIQTIKPETCRQYAMDNFHFRKTTEKYLPIYKEMLQQKTNK
jgi:glycosyltransferase involved in cell wall biosynthesis